MDGRLPVTGKPVSLGIGEKELAERVLLGKEHFQLPIVYLTKKWDGCYPLNAELLSEQLQRTAHVLKETTPELGKLLRKNVTGKIRIMEPLEFIIPVSLQKIKRSILNHIRKKFCYKKLSI